MTRYRCGRCKYVYDPSRGDPQSGIPGGTPFAALPESWHCPVSGAPKGEFSVLRDPQDAEKPPEELPKPARPAAGQSPAQNQPSVAPGPAPRPSAGVWTVGSLKPKRDAR